MSSELHIYHERQTAALCGQHCLNNLLQGCYFTPSSLSDIALELDKMERKLGLSMGAGIDVNNLRFGAAGYDISSGNVDESGNFSIQVLRTALQQSHSIELASWSGEDDKAADPMQESGFVVNRSDHWFTIRKINGRFWNLNSTLEQPEEISSFYLMALLHQLRSDGYVVFLAKGRLPAKGDMNGGDYFCEEGTWHKESILLQPKASGSGSDNKNSFVAFQGHGNRLGGSASNAAASNDNVDDMMLAQAIAASLNNGGSSNNSSSGTHINHNSTESSSSSNSGGFFDRDLELALQLSLAGSQAAVAPKEETEQEKRSRVREARLKALGQEQAK